MVSRIKHLFWFLIVIILSYTPKNITPQYSNLVDRTIQEMIHEKLASIGVNDEYITDFFSYVDLYNDAIDRENLVPTGFVAVESFDQLYDEYKLADLWRTAHPDFLGTNCRITSFSLFQDFIHIKHNKDVNTSTLVMDLYALDYAPSTIFSENARDKFTCFYSAIPTSLTKDKERLFKDIQACWSNRGISIDEVEGLSLISVYMHSYISDDEIDLFIGHTGLLLEDEGGKLLFLEKLAFEAPYQLTTFCSRSQLYDYLMDKYDDSAKQPTASPIILENDEIMTIEDLLLGF